MTNDEPRPPYIHFPLRGENAIEIRLRAKVSREDFECIKKLVDLSEPSLIDDTDTALKKSEAWLDS